MCRAKLPVPPGFTISTEVCNIYFQNKNNVPEDIHKRDAAGSRRRSRSRWARNSATPHNPLLVSVRSGAKFSMPGMMNTILNLGLNDETVEGAGKPRAAIRASPTIATAASSRCSATWCWKSTRTISTHLRRAQEEGQGQARYRSDRRGPEGRHRGLSRSWSRRRPASRFRRTPSSSSPCRATPCSAPGSTTRAKHYRKMNKIPDDLGTAVNVQAMVFGNMGETSATGVGFTRNPGHRREGILRRVPGERAGRRRGGRHPHAAAHRRARER